MFKVVNKEDMTIYNVYDVVYDKNGYPHFLMFIDGQWKRESAKHYVPYEEKM